MTALPNALALQRSARWERLGLASLITPALLLIVVTMLLPVCWLFYLSVLSDAGNFSLEHYQRMWEQPSYGRTFVTTFKVSLLTTGICILLGYPLAYFLSELPKRAATLCMVAVLLPLWTSLLVRTYAWLVLLQRRGLINTWGMAATFLATAAVTASTGVAMLALHGRPVMAQSPPAGNNPRNGP